MDDKPARRHAKLGPSSSDIWLTCLGAPAEWEKRPPKKPGFAAKEGTLAHTLCEAALLMSDIPWKEGQTYTVEGELIQITQEMLNAVSLYATTATLLSDISDWRAVEQEVYFDWLWGSKPPAEDLFGTGDFMSCDGTTLYVLDFKYGHGKAVQPFQNPQLMIYGLGAFGKLQKERPDLAGRIESVCLAIVQPRAGGDPVRQWVISIGDLLYWGYAVLKATIDRILTEVDLPLVPGNHCFFCAAAFDCPAYHRMRVKASIASFPEWKEEEGLDMI